MKRAFAVVDLFAGAGGLGEGFASFEDDAGRRPFRIEISVENDEAACETLRLRRFLGQFGGVFPDDYYQFLNGDSPEPDWTGQFPRQWERASREVVCRELGRGATTRVLSAGIVDIRRRYGGRTVLIGGPPCQAYSLVGRCRNAGREDYDPDTDERLVLYREYARVLQKLNPGAFVMENVKGILSSSRRGRAVFGDVLRRLESAGSGYVLYPMSPRAGDLDDTDPKRFVVRAEDHGIPQARHRVILVGLRSDIAAARGGALLNLQRQTPCAAWSVLDRMPRQRSRLSRGRDSASAWSEAVLDAATEIASWARCLPNGEGPPLVRTIEEAVSGMNGSAPVWRKRRIRVGRGCPADLRRWILDDRLTCLRNNETRGHMPSDIGRYLFVSAWGKAMGGTPLASDFPAFLEPRHRSWVKNHFSDRFRVQLGEWPASTITSHISKDGHYYIHPDPAQCRSLTVREAARLQTFPDNYVFKGNRTQQYVQVGNAVPPFLARQVADRIWRALTSDPIA